MKLSTIEYQGYFASTASKILEGLEEAICKTEFKYCGGRGHLTIGKVVVKGDSNFIDSTHSISYKVATSRQLIIIISFLVVPIISLLKDSFKPSLYCSSGRGSSALAAEFSSELVTRSSHPTRWHSSSPRILLYRPESVC